MCLRLRLHSLLLQLLHLRLRLHSLLLQLLHLRLNLLGLLLPLRGLFLPPHSLRLRLRGLFCQVRPMGLGAVQGRSQRMDLLDPACFLLLQLLPGMFVANEARKVMQPVDGCWGDGPALRCPFFLKTP